MRIGDTEEFYVVSSDTENTLLIAKYNLLVGNIIENYIVIETIDPSTEGYGLQSSETKYADSGNRKGTIAFSTSYDGYWYDYDNGGLLSPYNKNGASLSGNPYPYVYDSNSNLYSYVNSYVDKLKSVGAPASVTGRLLSYEEAYAIKDVKDNETSIISNSYAFWLGSAGGKMDEVCYSSSWGMLCGDSVFAEASYGIRPVIIIPTSEI